MSDLYELSYGEVLKELRIYHDYKQKDISDYLNITSQAYSNYENNKRTPDIETMRKVAQFYKITVDVELPHTHEFADATCTEPSKCECGETQVDALGHSFAFGECTRCGVSDPDYVAPQPPVEEPPVEEPQNLFQRIIDWIMDLINQILAMFKK